MLDIGFSELLVFGIIGLLVLGPEKLPQALRSAARYYHKFKSTISNLQNDIDRELRVSELREQMKNEMDRIQALEQKMQAQMQQLQQQKIMDEPAQAAAEMQSSLQVKTATVAPSPLYAPLSEQHPLHHKQRRQQAASHPKDGMYAAMPLTYCATAWFKQDRCNRTSSVPYPYPALNTDYQVAV